eukprot:CAMPEP_0182419180 /NCGR_PEP_ID=MMETSP1167-20130531/3584_1 /TAXON_ID=2988 /ORGANISM="Mallomonas Sp, Strain CCMP3275" /LENGTH=149 /DNA_ID=CAMNT_0024593855 /DNA_START=327 /DNA_END=777 /DNA_ORIENTATION=+
MEKKNQSETEEWDDEDYDPPPKGLQNDFNFSHGPFKMMLCVNMSLKMDKGKIAAQCGHATLGAYRYAGKHCKSALKQWEHLGQAKVAVKVENLESMQELEQKARSKGLVTYIVTDAGKTQIAAGSQTVLAIGPAPVSILQTITGELKLL